MIQERLPTQHAERLEVYHARAHRQAIIVARDRPSVDAAEHPRGRLPRRGGTLAAFLGLDVLARGFEACIYSYDLHLFDPTWSELDTPSLTAKLRQQLAYKRGVKFRTATEAYIRFLQHGGELRFADLSLDLLRTYFDRKLPVLAGLSATYLYRTMREYAIAPNQTAYHDLQGEPAGHFVVLYGLSESGVRVADPYRANPFEGHFYEVNPQRLLNAILLGIATYDANLLIVSPPLQQ